MKPRNSRELGINGILLRFEITLRSDQRMPKLRVYQLARELNADNSEIIRELQHMGVPVTSHSNTVEDRLADQLRKKFAAESAAAKGSPSVASHAAPDAYVDEAPIDASLETAPLEPVVEAAPLEVEKPAHARVEVKAEPKVEPKAEPKIEPKVEVKPEHKG